MNRRKGLRLALRRADWRYQDQVRFDITPAGKKALKQIAGYRYRRPRRARKQRLVFEAVLLVSLLLVLIWAIATHNIYCATLMCS